MTSQTVEVTNKVGLHARPASLLIKTAKSYGCTFSMTKDGQSSDLRSIFSLMKLKVKQGDLVTISADGEDEAQAVQDIARLIESKFGED